MELKITTEDFIKRAIKQHGDTYDYTETVYLGAIKKLTIRCILHGTFNQIPGSHINGKGCPICGDTKRKNKAKNTLKLKKSDFHAHVIPPEGCKIIPLSKEKYCIIDEEDFEKVNEFNWGINGKINNQYARCTIEGEVTLMHRFILNLLSKDLHVDHKNNDTLDNRKINLRTCTYSQNNKNKNIQNNGTSKYKGVSWDKSKNKWITSIVSNGKTVFKSSFDDEEKAAVAYDNAAIKYHKEFAKTNFITDENGNRKFIRDILKP